MKNSKKEVDINGFVTYKDNPITKIGVFPYLGREIGAPDPDRIYYVYRPEEELNNPETIQSANLVPWIDEHEFLGKDGTPAEEKGVQGTTGESSYFESPYLKNNIRIYTEYLMNQVDGGKVDLSPCYRAKYEFKQGEFEGARYEAIQRNIRFNHLASVNDGRTGKDVAVQDHSLTRDHFVITIDTSEFVKQVKEQSMFTEEQLAAIKQLFQEMLAEAQNPASDIKPEEPTKDQPEETTVSAPATTVAINEAEAAVEQAQEATESAAQAIETVKEEIASDAVNQAIKQIAERDSIAKRITPHIGVFDSSAMLSAQQVAEYGCKKLGIKSIKGAEIATLDGYLQNVKAPIETIAKDSKPVSSNDSVNRLWKEQK